MTATNDANGEGEPHVSMGHGAQSRCFCSPAGIHCVAQRSASDWLTDNLRRLLAQDHLPSLICVTSEIPTGIGSLGTGRITGFCRNSRSKRLSPSRLGLLEKAGKLLAAARARRCAARASLR